MVPGLFNDPTSRAVRGALGGLALRQQTIANNVANVDTPLYRARQVNFEAALQAELAAPKEGPNSPPKHLRLGLVATDRRHIPVPSRVESGQPRAEIVESSDGTLRQDGNTVDVEREMTKLAETQLMYTAMGQIAGNKLEHLRTAINEGRR